MTSRKLFTGYIALLITLVICVSRCQGQVYYTYNGRIIFTNKAIWIEDKKDSIDYELVVISIDSIPGRKMYSVVGFLGTGTVYKLSQSVEFHFKINGMRRSRMKQYIFK